MGRSAFAWNLFVETSFGFGENQSTGDFWTNSVTQSGYDLATQLSLGLAFYQSRWIDLEFGVAGFANRFQVDTTDYGYGSIYPFFRVSTPRFYLSFGATPYQLRLEQTSPNYLGYELIEDFENLSVIGEAGIVWRVVPDFHINIGVNMNYRIALDSFSPIGPAPSMSFFGAFKFYLFKVKSPTSGASIRTYDGWRYPFGIPTE